MVKKVYLIHGWGGSPNSEAWFPWLNNKCKEKNIELIIPIMPNTETPKINEWLNKLKEIVKINKETYFIGHSIGAQAIMRYLERLPKNKKVSGCIFIAGWFNLLDTAYEAEDEEGLKEEKAIANSWINTPLNLEKVKPKSKRFLAIFSNNDSCVPVSDSEIFKEKLGAEIIIKNNEEHFNDTKEIKEIMEFIEK